MSQPSRQEIEQFQELLEKYRYDFERLVYIVFPFGQKGHALEHFKPYDWQLEEWRKLSYHLMSPVTRYETYRLIISSGNGAAKTAFGAMTVLMLMYTQKLRARITANTAPQLSSVVWPEYDVWFRHARYSEHFFEKFGTSIKAKNPQLSETWRLDAVTWNEQSPASISGLHNKGNAIAYIFEEAPGIPATIWNYASGAFTETETIKLFLAFGNSDDPESKFEQNMSSSLWHARRIDTRTLKHIDPKQIADWLHEAGGNEDHDEFRVRVRGLPRKTAKDSIISPEVVNAAIVRAKGFDPESVKPLPVVLTCDPAWQGGDETTIWVHMGHYSLLLDKYKLDKTRGQDHMFTFNKMCEYESQYQADYVFIDQGEGTALYTLAMNSGRTHWELVSFAATPNDTAEFKDSQYANLRAQMHYEANQALIKGGILDAVNPDWIEDIRTQLCWTKGTRHKINGKKLCEAKIEIRDRVGRSPDVNDGFVLRFARPVTEKRWENVAGNYGEHIGNGALKMPDHESPYDDIDASGLYD